MLVFLTTSLLVVTGCGSARTVQDTLTITTTETTTRVVTNTVERSTPAGVSVFVPMCGQLLYRPARISYYCGHQYVADIRWRSYGGEVAVGRGKYASLDCMPSCADGHYTFTPVTIILVGRFACRGSVAYSEWKLVGLGAAAPQEQLDRDGWCAG